MIFNFPREQPCQLPQEVEPAILLAVKGSVVRAETPSSLAVLRALPVLVWPLGSSPGQDPLDGGGAPGKIHTREARGLLPEGLPGGGSLASCGLSSAGGLLSASVACIKTGGEMPPGAGATWGEGTQDLNDQEHHQHHGSKDT